jgi:RNA polymerase sigma-70 factor (ECF subfamily)
MEEPTAEDPVTMLLKRWSRGDREAEAEVLPLLYDELKKIAVSQFRRERGEHTLQATALVHEAYLRLGEQRGLEWRHRSQFYAVAAHVMRQVLVDHARGRNRAKRGAGEQRVTLSEAAEVAAGRPPDLLALDDALTQLAAVDPRKGTVVELRYFGGFSIEETAAHLGISVETVGREWRRAKAFLRRELAARPEGAEGAP